MSVGCQQDFPNMEEGLGSPMEPTRISTLDPNAPWAEGSVLQARLSFC